MVRYPFHYYWDIFIGYVILKRYRWAITSIFLVTIAQVLLRLAMHTGPDTFSLVFFLSIRPETLYLFLGLFSYGLSLLSWTRALRNLPLAEAYPLLSLSYILVWITSLFIPTEKNSLSYQAVIGIGRIIMGIYLIMAIKKDNPPQILNAHILSENVLLHIGYKKGDGVNNPPTVQKNNHPSLKYIN